MRVEDEPIAVLYVNDDPDLLELLATGLERENDRLTVRTTTSAREGLDAVRGGDVDWC
jgi:CheY-like chemotaxis protein